MSQGETKIKVKLEGLVPIMFDRYSGDNGIQLDPEDKVYKNKKGQLHLPAINIVSFLSAQNTESAPQRILGRGWRAVAKAALSFVIINPMEIPFTKKGKAATLKDIHVENHVARVKKAGSSIPMLKERPVLDAPWELVFEINLIDNKDLQENVLKKLFEQGGISIGLGTFRGVYGKFAVKEWKVK